MRLKETTACKAVIFSSIDYDGHSYVNVHAPVRGGTLFGGNRFGQT